MTAKSTPALEQSETIIRMLSQTAELLLWLTAAAPDGVDWKTYGGYARRMVEDAMGELNTLKALMVAPDDELPF